MKGLITLVTVLGVAILAVSTLNTYYFYTTRKEIETIKTSMENMIASLNKVHFEDEEGGKNDEEKPEDDKGEKKPEEAPKAPEPAQPRRWFGGFFGGNKQPAEETN